MLVLGCLEAIRKVAPELNVFSVYLVLTLVSLFGGVLAHLTIERPVVKLVQNLLGLNK
jgi:hypothetical protein